VILTVSFADSVSQDVRVKSVPITTELPLLGTVFGHMTHAEEARIRAGIVDSGGRLNELAERLGGGAKGFELELMELGQAAITMHVGVLDSGRNSVVFGVEVSPSWSNLGRQWSHEAPSWVIETWIDADCLHTPAHDALESVYTHEAFAEGPLDASTVLQRETESLIALATGHPVDHWTDKTRD
jgi:hypothetical protein